MASIAERIAAATKAAEAAEARVSDPAFVQEETDRRTLAELQERERVARERERDIIVDRALDAAPDGAEAVIIESPLAMPAKADAAPGSPVYHFFIVCGAGSAAYKAFQTGLADAGAEKIAKGTRQKVSRDDVLHAYAVAGTVGWYADGKPIDIENDSEAGALFNAFLRANPAVVTQLMDRVARLDGAASEARKR